MNVNAWFGSTAAKYGVAFVVYALAMDLLDDILIPGALALFGHPALGAAAFAADLDWITYPLFFIALAAWNAWR